LLLAGLLAVGPARVGLAVPVVDQQVDAFLLNPSPSIVVSMNSRVAQTLTAGSEGLLTDLGLQLFEYTTESDPLAPFTVEIASVLPDGRPNDAAIFGSRTVTMGQLPHSSELSPGVFTMIDVRSFDLWLSPGDELAIIVSSTFSGLELGWQFTGGDPHAGGSMWDFNPFRVPLAWNLPYETADVGFQTWVDPVPEPGTASLVGVGLVILARRRL